MEEYFPLKRRYLLTNRPTRRYEPEEHRQTYLFACDIFNDADNASD
jgi:hypothetical protein